MQTETLIERTQGEWKVNIPEYSTRFFITDANNFLIAEIEKDNKPRNEAKKNTEFICKAVNNYDSMLDALNQCHNLFEAEERNLSDQGKQVWQSVIAAILKANHKN